MTRAQFHAFLVDPQTGPRLDAMLADNAQVVEPAERPGPRPCCGEFGVVTICDGDTDWFYCAICERVWTARCA